MNCTLISSFCKDLLTKRQDSSKMPSVIAHGKSPRKDTTTLDVVQQILEQPAPWS